MDENNFVHIFVCCGRFTEAENFTHFVEPTYTEDGEMICSKFMTEIELESYEPMAIEHKQFYPEQVDLIAALALFSYSDQFGVIRLDKMPIDTIVCVYSPNIVRSPNRSSLDYIGAFRFDPN